MKLLIFDIDGTLTHLDGSTFRAFQAAFREVFACELMRMGITMHGRTDPMIFRDCFYGSGLAGDWEAAYREFKPVYIRNLPTTIQDNPRAHTKPGIPELLDALSARSDRCKLALGTGNGEAGGRIKVGHFDLNRYFPVGGFGDDHPERRLIMEDAIRAAEEHYGVNFEPDETWVIGDTVHDVEGGQALGLRTLAVATGGAYTYEQLEEAGPDLVFLDLSNTAEVLQALDLE